MLRAFLALMTTFAVALVIVVWIEATRAPEILAAEYTPPPEEAKVAEPAAPAVVFEEERLTRAAHCTVHDMTQAEGFAAEWLTEYEALGAGSLSVETLQGRAGEGDVTAMELLAFHFANRGGEGDETLAGDWMMQAAEAGSVVASQEVGFARVRGTLGLETDLAEGVRWLNLAYEAGDPIAAHNLGDLYTAGTIAPPPDLTAEDAALDAYLTAAAGCYDDSLEVISDRLKRGRGVPRDLEAAGWIDRNIRIFRN